MYEYNILSYATCPSVFEIQFISHINYFPRVTFVVSPPDGRWSTAHRSVDRLVPSLARPRAAC